MTTVTLLSPERASTGTQIAVEDNGARLIFDLGMVFDPAGNPFAYVDRRPGRELADLMELGQAQHLPNVYAPEYLEGVRVPPVLPPIDGPTAVALSHSHLDHSHLVGFVDESVPIYATPATARIVQVHNETGAILGTLKRPIEAVAYGEPFQMGSMRVRFLPVDHDVGGASGLLIETADGVIAFTGDIRLHGAHPEKSLGLARAAREAGARLWITEGNRLFPPPEPGAPPPAPERVEADIAPSVRRALDEIPGALGVIMLTPENGERVEAVAQEVATAGRVYVSHLSGLAYSMAALGGLPIAPTALYMPPDLAAAVQRDVTLPPSLRAVLEAVPHTVTPEEIAANPGGYLLHLPLHRFADLLDMNPAGGVIIRSNGGPLGPFDPAYPHVFSWAEKLGMTVGDIHSTGHAMPRDLALLALHSGAPTVMSVHSRYPELLPIPPERLLLPERFKSYEL